MEATARIGASIVVRGEMIAQEDVLIAGRVEGTIRIEGHRVTVAPGGRIALTWIAIGPTGSPAGGSQCTSATRNSRSGR